MTPSSILWPQPTSSTTSRRSILPKLAINFFLSISHPVLRQSVRDYFVNQQFRRDIFAKGYRRLTQLEQNEALRQQAFVLLMNADDVPMKVAGSLGEATLQEEIYRPIIQALADDGYAPKTLASSPRIPSSAPSRLHSFCKHCLYSLAGATCTLRRNRPGKQGRGVQR